MGAAPWYEEDLCSPSELNLSPRPPHPPHPMSAPVRERRIVLLAVASLGLLPRLGARAQTPTVPGNAPVTITGAPALPSGASMTVIDSAEISASGARTLSELLMARVPGLSVRYR